MKAIITNLPELVGENQMMLGQLFLQTMYMNGFKVDDVIVEFQPDEGQPVQTTNPLLNPKGQG